MDMNREVPDEATATPVQQTYARLLGWGVRLGFILLVVGFLLYAVEILPSQVPPAQLPDYWKLPVQTYLARTGAPTGWGWLALLPQGDMMSLLAIAVLCGVTLMGFLVVLPMFWRSGDRAYVVITLLEMAVLLTAASGILTAGR